MRINTALGNRPGMAGSYHQLGLVAQARGDYDAALKYLEQSLAIQREIGDRAGEGTTLNNLATTAYNARGDYDAALDWYRKSLAISEQLGDRAGMARSFSQIGVLYTQVRPRCRSAEPAKPRPAPRDPKPRRPH